MNIKNVVNEFGERVDIDYDTRKLWSYDNDKKRVTWNAEIVEEGKGIDFWTTFNEKGTIESLEERCRVGHPLGIYAQVVNYYASKNDPDRVIYKKMIEKVRAHEDWFFTKSGNHRDHLEPEVIEYLKDYEN